MVRQASFTEQHIAIKRVTLSLNELAKFRPLMEEARSSVGSANALLAHIDATGDGEFLERQASPYTVARKLKSEEERISKLSQRQLVREINKSVDLLNKN